MKISPEPLAGPSTPPGGRGRRAVFIDKDGTLVENVPYNVDPALLRFTPHAPEALWRLAEAGYLLIVVSNQPGVGFGYFDLSALRRLERALTAKLALEGVVLTGFYACPHAPFRPDEEAAAPSAPLQSAGLPHDRRQRPRPPAPRPCRCRKPAPGLLLEAAKDHAIDLAGSWMVGDILDDVETGWRAGCRSVHLDVGNETVWHRSPIRLPTHTVPNLLAAAEAILTSAHSLPFALGRSRRIAAMNLADGAPAR